MSATGVRTRSPVRAVLRFVASVMIVSGIPTECMHGTNLPSSPRTSRAPAPIRVMIRMLTAT